MGYKRISIEVTVKQPEENVAKFPATSGVYFVFSATRTKNSKYILHQLVYIGEAEDVHDRLNKEHKELDACRRNLPEGQTLFIAMARVDHSAREQCEAACIYHHRSQLKHNIKNTKTYEDDDVTINIEGLTYPPKNFSTSFQVKDTRKK